MKSKRAEEFINGHIKIGNLQFTVADIEYCVMLAEQDAEEEIEALKARAAEAFKEYMEQAHGGYLTSDLDNFIRKLNDR